MLEPHTCFSQTSSDISSQAADISSQAAERTEQGTSNFAFAHFWNRANSPFVHVDLCMKGTILMSRKLVEDGERLESLASCEGRKNEVDFCHFESHIAVR